VWFVSPARIAIPGVRKLWPQIQVGGAGTTLTLTRGDETREVDLEGLDTREMARRIDREVKALARD